MKDKIVEVCSGIVTNIIMASGLPIVSLQCLEEPAIKVTTGDLNSP